MRAGIAENRDARRAHPIPIVAPVKAGLTMMMAKPADGYRNPSSFVPFRTNVVLRDPFRQDRVVILVYARQVKHLRLASPFGPPVRRFFIVSRYAIFRSKSLCRPPGQDSETVDQGFGAGQIVDLAADLDHLRVGDLVRLAGAERRFRRTQFPM